MLDLIMDTLIRMIYGRPKKNDDAQFL